MCVVVVILQLSLPQHLNAHVGDLTVIFHNRGLQLKRDSYRCRDCHFKRSLYVLKERTCQYSNCKRTMHFQVSQ